MDTKKQRPSACEKNKNCCFWQQPFLFPFFPSHCGMFQLNFTIIFIFLNSYYTVLLYITSNATSYTLCQWNLQILLMAFHMSEQWLSGLPSHFDSPPTSLNMWWLINSNSSSLDLRRKHSHMAREHSSSSTLYIWNSLPGHVKIWTYMNGCKFIKKYYFTGACYV